MPDDTDLLLDLKLGPKFVKSPLAILGNPEDPIQTGLDEPIYRDSDGNPIITEPLERHENLMNWFGDSKVVDEKGKPLKLYHGAGSQGVRVFNDENGIYFTADIEEAREYSEQSGVFDDKGLIESYVSLQNPLMVEYDPITAYTSGHPNFGKESESSFLTAERKANYIKDGYDGIIAKTPTGEIWEVVAFHKNQVKSVRNRGTFNPEDPDIMAKRTKKGKSLRIKA